MGRGGGILGPSDLDLGKKVGSLDWGGILGPSDLDLGKKVGSLDWGGILGPSDLDLGKKVGSLDWEGYSGTLGFGLSDNFHLGGRGCSVPSYYRIGVFCGIWTKISTTPAGSCITDSLSHTTYVETNKFHSNGKF